MERLMKRTFLFMVAVLLGLPLGSVRAQGIQVNEKGEVVEQAPSGEINWTARRIEAIGMGSDKQDMYGQIEAAKVKSRAELLKVIEGVRIKGDYGVIEGINRGDITREHLEGFLQFSRVEEPNKNKFGLIEVKAYVYMDKSGKAVLFPDRVMSAPGVAPKPYVPPAPVASAPVKYSGLIVDARGLGLKPAMVPRVLCEGSLTEVYGPGTADPGVILSQGVAGYAGTPEKARSMTTRIGDKPLEIQARSATNGTDLVVSQEDAQRLAGALQTGNFLKECKVVIVLN